MKLNPDERVAYIQAVWETFKKHSQVERDMTNREYHFASKWLNREIPLIVVIRAIEDFSSRPRTLEAVENEVMRAYKYWSASMGMKP